MLTPMAHASLPERFIALFSTVMGGLADGLLRPLVGSFSLMFLLVLPFDTWGFLQDPHGYAVGQHLDVSQPHWEWQYVQRNFLLFAATGLVVGLVVASYFKPQLPLLRLGCRLVVTAVFTVGVFNFYQSAVSGFDH
jgi:hypothetical protein